MDKYAYNNLYNYYRKYSVETICKEYNKLKHDAQQGNFEAVEIMLDINTALNKLKTTKIKQYRCFVLYYILDYKEEEISKLLNITVSTVSEHKKNAIQTIRILLIGKEKVDKIDKEFNEKADAHKVFLKLRGEI